MKEYELLSREELLQELERKDELLEVALRRKDRDAATCGTLLRRFVEQAPATMAMFDREIRYLAASPSWAQRLHLHQQELVGLTHYDLVPGIPEEWKEAHRRGVQGEVVSSPGAQFVGKDGKVKWVRWAVQPWYAANDSVGGIVIVSEDITGLKDSEEALKKSERRYRDIVQNQTEFVDRYLPDGTITFVNNALAGCFGVGPEEFVGKNLYSFIHEEDRDKVLQAIGSLSAENPVAVVENRAFLPDGEHLQQWKNIALLDEAGNIVEYQGTGRDITDLRRMQDDLIRNRNELKMANEMLEERVQQRTAELEAAIKEQESFSYSVSHDLRAPLRHINSYSTILMEEHGSRLSAEAWDYMRRICVSAKRMGDLIDHLLELSRVTRVEIRRETVDLTWLANSTLKMLGEIDPARQVDMQVQDGMEAKGDRALIRQLMLNLLGNAWKYTAMQPQARIQFGCADISGTPTFHVRDNGVGLDMTYREKLFRPFERLHGAEFEGIGIGLATAQKIIKRHGGAIWAEGEPGKGATFYFTLAR